VIRYVEQGIGAAFLPRSMRGRLSMHGFATAIGTASTICALRLQGGLSWSLLLWYLGGFGVAHVVMVPVLSCWFAALHALERTVAGMVEKELIRIDLRDYRATLNRVFPGSHTSSEE
jgi:hypothetical protein